jgi:hypothetical protein
MFVAMIAASPGTHAIADTPAAVIIAVGLVIAAVVSDAAFDSHTGYRAGSQS